VRSAAGGLGVMVQADGAGGRRRCEILGLRSRICAAVSGGVHRRGKRAATGGWRRRSPTFVASVADYLSDERPADAAPDRGLVALNGPRPSVRCSEGLDKVLGMGERGGAGSWNLP
jgi:hypothetical protein